MCARIPIVTTNTCSSSSSNNNNNNKNNNSDKLSSILNPRERSSPLSPDKDDTMTFEKMASIREDYIKQPHHRTTGRPQREKTSPPPNNFAMLRPSSMNTLDSYGKRKEEIRIRTRTSTRARAIYFISDEDVFGIRESIVSRRFVGLRDAGILVGGEKYR